MIVPYETVKRLNTVSKQRMAFFQNGPGQDDWTFIPKSLLPEDVSQHARAKKHIVQDGVEGFHYAVGWKGLQEMMDKYGENHKPPVLPTTHEALIEEIVSAGDGNESHAHGSKDPPPTAPVSSPTLSRANTPETPHDTTTLAPTPPLVETETKGDKESFTAFGENHVIIEDSGAVDYPLAPRAIDHASPNNKVKKILGTMEKLNNQIREQAAHEAEVLKKERRRSQAAHEAEVLKKERRRSPTCVMDGAQAFFESSDDAKSKEKVCSTQQDDDDDEKEILEVILQLDANVNEPEKEEEASTSSSAREEAEYERVVVIQQLTNELEKLRAESQMEKESLTVQGEKLSAANEELTAELEQVKKAHDDLQSQAQEHEEALDFLEKEVLPETEIQLKTALGGLRLQKEATKQAEEQLKEKDDKFAALEKDKEEEKVRYEKMIEESRNAYEKVKSEAVGNQETMEQIRQQLMEVQKELLEEQAKSQDLERQLEAMSDTIATTPTAEDGETQQEQLSPPSSTSPVTCVVTPPAALVDSATICTNIDKLLETIEKCDERILWISKNPTVDSKEEAEMYKNVLCGTKQRLFAQLQANNKVEPWSNQSS